MDEHMVFEDIYDAIRHTVQRSGGAKAVGAVLYPDKQPDAAARYLLDCLNTARPEKLDTAHLMIIVRIGHRHGCHSIVNYLCQEAGYSRPQPLSSADERAELQREYIRAVNDLRAMFRKVTDLEGAA